MKANEAPLAYPIQFKDKIDEYLWKEHHILGGCCSSIESMKYAVAREVVEKLTDAFIKKACDFFEENIEEEDCKIGNSEWTELRAEYESLDSFIRAFKNYMKGE